MIIENNVTIQDGTTTTVVTPTQLAVAVKSAAAGVNREYNGEPTGTLRENMPRNEASSAVVSLPSSGTPLFVALPLFAGDVVASLTFVTGTTALNGGTHQYAALYGIAASGTSSLLSKSNDNLATAWSTDLKKTFTLATAQPITTTGIYYAALLVTGGTLPNFYGRLVSSGTALNAGPVSGQVALAQSQGSSATDMPATWAGGTPVAGIPYVAAS